MSLLKTVRNSVTKSGSVDLIPSGYRGGEPWHFFGNDGTEKIFRYADCQSSLKAYQQCPPLAAIINRKAQAYINGKTYVMNISGRSKGKESTGDFANKVRKLMARPNPIQSWKQFKAQQYIYTQLFGFSLLLVIIPAGFEKYGASEATSMWNIPPSMLSIDETNKLFYQTDLNGIIKTIKLHYKGQNTELDLKNVHIFKDITPSFNTLVFPESRVRALEMPINNIIGGLESENVLINYRGALGVFSHDQGSGQFGSLPLTPDQKKELQQDFLRYGLKNKQWKFIITTAAVKWQQVGIPTKDLMLSEMIKEASQMICDGYNYPPHLMGLIDPTFNNQEVAERGLYQNAIMPESESMDEQWNEVFKSEENNVSILNDFSHVAALQKDQGKEATARKTRNDALQIEFHNNMITLNRWLELNGEDPLPGEEGKKYYHELLKLGWKFGASSAAPANSNQNNNNGNQQQEGSAESGDEGEKSK